MKKSTATRLAAGAAMTFGLGLALAMPAQADHGGGSEASGHCTMGGQWELKASADDGGHGRHGHDGDHGRNRIEVEFKVKVDNGNRDLWNWMISDNGTVVKQGSGRANDELERRREVANLQGPDAVSFTATNTVSGNSCTGMVNVHGGHRH